MNRLFTLLEGMIHMTNVSFLRVSITMLLKMNGLTQSLFLQMGKLNIDLRKKDLKLLLVYLEQIKYLFLEDTQKKRALLIPLKDLI